MRTGKSGEFECLIVTMAQEKAYLQRGNDQRRLQKWIVNKRTGKDQRLVQPEDQCHAYRRQRLKAINWHNADKYSQKHSGSRTTGIEPLGKQSGCDLLDAS